MKTLATPRAAPHPLLQATVEVPGKGPVTLRLPDFGTGLLLHECWFGDGVVIETPDAAAMARRLAAAKVRDGAEGTAHQDEAADLPPILREMRVSDLPMGARLQGKAFALAFCWADEFQALETVVPDEVPDPDAARRLGARVLQELQIAGYTWSQVKALTEGVESAINALYIEVKEARELADFTPATEGGSPSSPSTSASASSEATPTGSTSSPPSSA